MDRKFVVKFFSGSRLNIWPLTKKEIADAPLKRQLVPPNQHYINFKSVSVLVRALVGLT